MAITVRPETAHDHGPIHALTQAAFRDAIHSDGNEAAIVDHLRERGTLALSLVAVNMDRAVVGHVAFSPVTIDGERTGWFALGPLSVIPTSQRTGIGAQLVRRGIAEMQAAGARGIVLLGDPDYYARFGFRPQMGLTLDGVPAGYFQALVLEGEAPSGQVRYDDAFAA